MMILNRPALLFGIPALLMAVFGFAYNLLASIQCTAYLNQQNPARDYLPSSYYSETAGRGLYLFTATAAAYLILSLMGIQSIRYSLTDKAKWVIVYSIILYLSEIGAAALII